MFEIYVIEIPEKIEIEFFKEKLYNSRISSELLNTSEEMNRNKLISSFARAFVQQIVCEKFGFNENIPISYTEQGKPYFTNLPSVHFNISHSGVYVCIGIFDSPVGVDIERTRICKPEMVKRFFHANETSDVLKIQEGTARNIYFSKLWSLKESYVKFTGSGIANTFDTFFIRISDTNLVSISGNLEQVYFKSYNCFDDKYQLSVCSSKAAFPERPQFLSLEDL